MPEPSPPRILLARPSGSTPVVQAATTEVPDAPRPQLQVVDGSGDRPQPDAVITVGDAPVGAMRTASAPAPDIVIDLTGVPPALSVTADHGHSSTDDGQPSADHGVEVFRYRRMLLVLGTAAVVAGVLAVTNFAIGMQWRSQALADQERAARAAADAAAQQQAVITAHADRDAADLRRVAMARQLAVSETDVAALEARVSALASDRAQAEDYGNYAPIDSRARVRTLRAQIDSCVAQVAALRTSLEVGDVGGPALHGLASAAEATCEQIGADAAVLVADE